MATPNALNTIPNHEILAALSRHLRGDWGTLDAEDWQANEQALVHGGRLFSAYRSTAGVKFWIITEADRSVTTTLLTVNSQATYRKGEFFQHPLAVSNGSGPVAQSLSVAVSGVSTVTGTVLVPPAVQTFTYDADGNLTGDLLWTYTWDAENRLVKQESHSSVASAAKRKLEFAYDHQGRRIRKQVSTWNGSAWVLYQSRRFVYDGWNVIADLFDNNTLRATYLWGQDLSGTMQGAGGVGGLVFLWDHYTGKSCFTGYDGNGNLVQLVDGPTGNEVARYEYGPFGELIRETGTVAVYNPFRFSTKYYDRETGLSYYGHRYYNPSTGRWINRDPIQERGGLNVYGFVGNSPQDQLDPDGRAPLGEFLGWLATQGRSLASQSEMTAVVLAGDFFDTALQFAIPIVDPAYASRQMIQADIAEFRANGLLGYGQSKYGQLEEMAGTSDLVRMVDYEGEYSSWERFGYGVRGGLKTATCFLGLRGVPKANRPPPLPAAPATATATESLLAAKTATPNGNFYSVAYEMRLNPADVARRDGIHFNRANAALDNAIRADAQFAAQMERLIPGARDAVSSVGGRANPPAWTWHHHPDHVGVLQLVPRQQHTGGSIFWNTMHPPPTFSGGYANWAVPAGAPPR